MSQSNNSNICKIQSDSKLTTSSPHVPQPESLDGSLGRSSQQEQPPKAEVPPSELRPFLIYNKVSAVINESKNVTTTSAKDEEENDEIAAEPRTEKDSKTGNSVWYEYGCV